MNLPALPDLRATENPSGPVVADDYTDPNSQLLPPCSARPQRQARPGRIGRRGQPSCCPTPRFVVSLFAARRIGAAVTPINPSPHRAEVSYQV